MIERCVIRSRREAVGQACKISSSGCGAAVKALGVQCQGQYADE